MLRPEPGDQLTGRAQGYGASMVHDRHSVAEALGFVHVMGGQQNRPAIRFEDLDQLPELPTGLGVEPGGRLVQEEQFGISYQGAGEGQPLLLAAGELTHAGMGLLLQLHHADHVCRGGTTAIEAAEEPHGLFDCELFGELGFLQGDAEQLA